MNMVCLCINLQLFRHIYFLSTDWYNADMPMHTAKIRIGERKFDVNIAYGRMLKAVVSCGVGAWFDSEDCDVIEITDNKITVQGTGIGKLSIAQNGEEKTVVVDFSESSVLYIEF